MKKVFLCLLFGVSVGVIYATDLMKYATMYQGCVDDEESTIYGASYSPYPKDLQDAVFPGGEVEMVLYLHQNTEVQEVYSGENGQDGTPLLLTGKVLVEFVVDRCGKPGRFHVVQSLSPEQDAEALRVMESLPIFKAASLQGVRVKAAYVAPIRFSTTRMPRKPTPVQYEDYYNNASDYSSDDYYPSSYEYNSSSGSSSSSSSDDDEYYRQAEELAKKDRQSNP